MLKVTPDPGVIEVNIQPVHNWDEAVKVTEGLYEDAHFSRLGTEKFMLDGRHTGTGGGNHIVIGGATPADSPFLRRPDLLKSLVAYWHNHPSLSYLFSGTFIGPTSQAPRADEGRPDNLYELEIAMKQIPAIPGQTNTPAWLVDRVFRNLLVDLTGNTHRAEFCIDKLYSPDSSSGRLGLVEFRGFEMPPHARMSLTQQLLLRTLIARFWEQPYEVPLVRWGTELHDRFLLPHFIAEDFQDLLRETREIGGIPIKPEWFAPHLEFRMPIYGASTSSPPAASTSNFARPSSPGTSSAKNPPAASSPLRRFLRRTPPGQGHRHGPIPPHRRTSTESSCPSIPPDASASMSPASATAPGSPLPACIRPSAFTRPWFSTSSTPGTAAVVSGVRAYHVSHPGGRGHEIFPINSFEAEGRRGARFFKYGHTPGPMQMRTVDRSLEFPFTLDLRRT